MNMRHFRQIALTVSLTTVTLGATASAQIEVFPMPVFPPVTCPTPLPQPSPQPVPLPQPQPQPFYLGVKAKTVPVDMNSTPIETFANRQQPRVMVAPGYGQTVYGQMIVSVTPNSPAYHAGLEPGDIIVDANGIPMDNGQNLAMAVQNSNGRMEMKVVDVNSNQLVWVVAELSGTDGGIIETRKTQRQKLSSAQKQPTVPKKTPNTIKIGDRSVNVGPITIERRPPSSRR